MVRSKVRVRVRVSCFVTSMPRPTLSNHSSDHAHLAVIGSKSHTHFRVRVSVLATKNTLCQQKLV